MCCSFLWPFACQDCDLGAVPGLSQGHISVSRKSRRRSLTVQGGSAQTGLIKNLEAHAALRRHSNLVHLVQLFKVALVRRPCLRKAKVASARKRPFETHGLSAKSRLPSRRLVDGSSHKALAIRRKFCLWPPLSGVRLGPDAIYCSLTTLGLKFPVLQGFCEEHVICWFWRRCARLHG